MAKKKTEKKKERKLELTNTVRKSNLLNEIRNADTTFVEYRLFCIFLAHFKMQPINWEEVANGQEPIYDNTVTFTLSDYAKIMDLDRPRREDLERQAKDIVRKAVQLPDDEDGGFETVTLFTKFKLHKNENDDWCVTITSHEDLSGELREQKKRFLRYKLYNVVFLKSFNQQRIYELLKQYEKIGEREIALEDLRDYLSIQKDEYSVWGDFSQKVIKVAQKEIKEHTDICFEFEPIKKKRKVVGVLFTIHKNEGYKDYLKLDQFIGNTDDDYDGEEIEVEYRDVTDDESQLEGQITWSEDAATVTNFVEEPTKPEKVTSLTVKLVDEMLQSKGYKFTPKKVETLCTEARKHLPYHMLPTKWNEYILMYVRNQVSYMESQDDVRTPYSYLKKCVIKDYYGHPVEDATGDLIAESMCKVPVFGKQEID